MFKFIDAAIAVVLSVAITVAILPVLNLMDDTSKILLILTYSIPIGLFVPAVVYELRTGEPPK